MGEEGKIMKFETEEAVCYAEFKNILKKLQKNVDRCFTEFPDKVGLSSQDEYVFYNIIDYKFAIGIVIFKEEINRTLTKKAIRNLFNIKLKQAILSLADTLEDKSEKLMEYYERIKDK